jgi:5,10-methylenetetrahydromethanopterin reductase
MRLGITLGVAGSGLGGVLRLARDAEAAGFDTISCGEAAYDTFACTAAVAGVTSHVRILSGAATWVRPPVATARGAATVDALSGGRYELGLGTMPPAWNERFYGITWERPLARMREYVEVVRGALRATQHAPLHHAGEFFTVDGFAPLETPLRPEIPVHLAVTRPGLARLAGEIADGVLVNVVHTVRWVADVLGPALDEGRARAGEGPSEQGVREPQLERGIMVRCAIAEDPAEALRRARTSLALYLDVPYLHELAAAEGHPLPAAPTTADLPEELVRRMCLVGSVEEVREQLRRYDGVADWVLLTPPSGLADEELRAATTGILDAFG